jgi:preprotein translocase subunit SecB
MADENPSNGADSKTPRFSVVAQYVKDLSFENPNAPRSFGPQNSNIELQVNVTGKQLAANDFEIVLNLEGGSGEGDAVIFKFELKYAGVFRVENVPPEQVQSLVMIEGPRLMFPFARQVIADAVRNGGYPPLYVDPIDFHRLYVKRYVEAAAPAAQA